MGQDQQALTDFIQEPMSQHERRPVTFQNRRGLRLVGILDKPAGQIAADVGIVMLSPGIKMRVGPERLYLRLSDAFVDMGYPVLRFDYHGLGDSEGVLDEPMLKDVYSQIETGRYVEDVQDAMDWMQREYGIRRFVASGLCGGAVTGLLTAQRESRIVALVALSITPVLSNTVGDLSRYMTVGQLTAIREGYIKKLVRPAAWLRLLTFQSDYGTLWRAAMKPWLAERRAARNDATAAAPTADNANPLFPPAFFAMLESGRPIMLIFGSSDRLHHEFEEKFAMRHRDRLTRVSSLYRMHVIAGANHVFTFETWQREVVRTACDWLSARIEETATAVNSRAS